MPDAGAGHEDVVPEEGRYCRHDGQLGAVVGPAAPGLPERNRERRSVQWYDKDDISEASKRDETFRGPKNDGSVLWGWQYLSDEDVQQRTEAVQQRAEAAKEAGGAQACTRATALWLSPHLSFFPWPPFPWPPNSLLSTLLSPSTLCIQLPRTPTSTSTLTFVRPPTLCQDNSPSAGRGRSRGRAGNKGKGRGGSAVRVCIHPRASFLPPLPLRIAFLVHSLSPHVSSPHPVTCLRHPPPTLPRHLLAGAPSAT